MSILTRQSRGFCEGCDFSGSIPPGSIPVRSAQNTTADRSVRHTVFFDGNFQMTHGVVDRHKPEAAPNSEDIMEMLQDKRKKCVGPCVLEAAGYVPVELSLESRRLAMEALLNSIHGVKELGEVEYIDDEDDDEEHEPTSAPVESLKS